MAHLRGRSLAWTLVCVPLLLLGGCGSSSAAPTPQPRVPRFEGASCPFKVGSGLTKGTDVRCGNMVVPEDRARPGGRTIRLAVAVFKSPDAHPASDPLVFLQGGPGGAIIKDLGSLINSNNNGVLVGKRDLILIDQRGTGYSRPPLDCTEATQMFFKTLKENLSPQKQVALLNVAVRQCHARMLRSGINLNAYTTLADAADIADLRRVLGYRSMNVYGVSYGTRVALLMMQHFPAGIRSVILDSVVPPRGNIFVDPSRSEGRVLRVIFNGCAQSPACSRRFPNLEGVFNGLVGQLNAKPIIIPSKDVTSGKRYQVLINGYGFSDLVSSAPYVTPLIPKLPKMIYQTQRGKYGLVSQVFGNVGFTFEGIDLGVYLSMACGDDAAFASRQQIDASVQGLPQVIRSYVRISRLGSLQQCQIWHMKTVDPSQKQVVRSSIPTLVLAGQYDPITPPSNGALVARTLSRSFYFQFPGTGHATWLSNRCPFSIGQAFLNHPTQKPDAGCIGTMGPPY